jgi:hypothetical protein
MYSKNITTALQCDKYYLTPLYEYLNSRIRAIDNKKMIFFEQSLIDLFEIKDGFTQVPGGPLYNNRSFIILLFD